ncbi:MULTISPECIES: TetR/AcrR family transcriptional regulator [Streptomyces]|uniref:TetR/AcrR family transcriptional regulator n=1 Tax=Streptomyces TaxID=1883 RepID=UPI000A3A4CAC|nr:TetR/AcrR family transcriptional regulator [Streptomyces viridochromogenes]
MTGTAGAVQARADSVRNRRLLLRAATEAFAECGADVPMHTIAQRAGVAKGTVFRHFPTKDDLLAAIMMRLLDRLLGTAVRLLRADDAGGALKEFMAHGIGLLAADRAFCDVIGRPSLQHADVREAIDRLCDAVEDLTARARAQGAVRGDITGTDIVLLLGGVHQTAQPLLDREPRAWERFLEITFDGLRARDRGALPHPPPARLRMADPSGVPASAKT